MDTNLYLNAFLSLIVAFILGLLFYCYYAETFKRENMLVDGQIIDIVIEDYYYYQIQTSLSYDFNGFNNAFSIYQISHLPIFNTEMVIAQVKVTDYIGNILTIKFDISRNSFEQMNFELGKDVSLNCHKMKFEKKFTFDQFSAS